MVHVGYVLAFLCCFGSTFGQSVLLTNDVREVPITNANALWQAPDMSFINVPAQVRWLKIPIQNQSSQLFLLEGLSPHTDHLYFFIQQGNRWIHRMEAGRDQPFLSRWLDHKNFTFPLPTDIGHYTVWVAIDSPRQGDWEFKIRSFHFFSEYAFYEYFLLGLYYGLLVVAALYNLFMYLKSKIRVHLLYSLYLIGCAFLSFREDGIGYQFVWPFLPEWNALFMLHVAQPFFLITFLTYSISLLGLRKHRVIYKLLLATSGVYLVYNLYSYFLPPPLLPPEWLIAIISTIVYATSIAQWKSNVYARYFAVGFTMVVISFLINLLRFLGMLPSNVATVYSFNYGIFLEVILFSIAMAERVREMQSERNKALTDLVEQLHENDRLQKNLIQELHEKKALQEKVTKELEQKVRERTVELHASNEKLKEYAQKLDQINTTLDIHNFNLRNEVKEAKLSLVNVEKVSFPTFMEIFQNDHQCLKTVENLKWPNGFVCFKCGNKHSSQATYWYRQKCSRCGTIESVTAHTLFHNTRIPLTKAFYIAYATFSEAELTLEMLSEHLGLRKATVWLFRKKVEERMHDKRYAKAETWQQLILDRA